MSWQTYVDDQLLATKIVKHAVICGHDGTIWAKSAGFNVSADEMKALLAPQSGDVHRLLGLEPIKLAHQVTECKGQSGGKA